MTQKAHTAVEIIKKTAPHFQPELAIVLGSGLGKLADAIEDAHVFSYADLPGFPPCSVSGHGGKLYLGKLFGVNVACMQGRAHYYEGVSYEQIKTPIRTLKLLGCKTLLSTNSSGSLQESTQPGSLVVINDHINFQFHNPLVGPNEDAFGPRFIGMEDIYDVDLRTRLFTLGESLGIKMSEGVYLGVIGPSFETPAEIRAYRMLGADVVGMSTIPEVIVAHHAGLKIAVVSVITNMAAGMSEEKLTHEGTLSGAAKAADNLIALVTAFLKDYQHAR